MKILLHAPLHPSYWVYLMETMPEHEWFIEPKEDFEEGATPRDQIKYTIVPSDSNIKFDAQIIFLPSYLDLNKLYKLLANFPIPPVFIEVWKYPLPQLEIKYPLISGCTYCSNSQYPNIRYSYVPPSKTLWNKEWIGNKSKIFIPAQRYLAPEYSHSKIAKIVPLLKKTNIPLDIIENKKRNIPFSEWQDKFVHDRVLFSCSQKYVSFVIEEAMMVGMPIVSLNQNETSVMVRDKIDGFTIWTDDELIELLRKFITDKDFAKEWSLKSKARGKEIFDPDKTDKIFNQALNDAIVLFNSVKDPFKIEKGLPKLEFSETKSESKPSENTPFKERRRKRRRI